MAADGGDGEAAETLRELEVRRIRRERPPCSNCEPWQSKGTNGPGDCWPNWTRGCRGSNEARAGATAPDPPAVALVAVTREDLSTSLRCSARIRDDRLRGRRDRVAGSCPASRKRASSSGAQPYEYSASSRRPNRVPRTRASPLSLLSYYSSSPHTNTVKSSLMSDTAPTVYKRA